MTTAIARRTRNTPLDTYLAEIDSTPLLDAAEEQALAGRIALGDVEARDRMVRANLRLVVNIARQYAGKGLLPLDDLIAEGNLGLLRAAEGFDPAAGTRFSTYAGFWVKQSIRRALSRDASAVRLPQYTVTLLARWRQAAAALERELGRTPSDEEVAGRLGLTARQARIARQARRVWASGRTGEEPEGAAPVDLLADDAGAPGEDLAGADEVRRAVGSLAGLAAREAAVLRLRFGLDGQPPATLQRVGEVLGCTRERVRQIEVEALAKLRGRLVA